MAGQLRTVNQTLCQMQKNLECAICLDLLQDPVSTKCDHQFCSFCILALLDNSRRSSAPCPLCKESVTKRSLTSNDRLNDIVRALRTVVQAVEEDTGLKCTPPRGPRVLSQQAKQVTSPEPETADLMKDGTNTTRSKTSRKVSKEPQTNKSRNIRRAKSKVTGSFPVYEDSDDSDESQASNQSLKTDLNSNDVKGPVTRRSSRNAVNRKPLGPANQQKASKHGKLHAVPPPAFKKNIHKSVPAKELQKANANDLLITESLPLLQALHEGSLGVLEGDRPSRREIPSGDKERKDHDEGDPDPQRGGLLQAFDQESLGRVGQLDPDITSQEINVQANADCLNRDETTGERFQINPRNESGETAYQERQHSGSELPSCPSDTEVAERIQMNPENLDVGTAHQDHQASCSRPASDLEDSRRVPRKCKLALKATLQSSDGENPDLDPYEFIPSQRTPRKPRPKRGRQQKHAIGKASREFDYMKWKKTEKRAPTGSQVVFSQSLPILGTSSSDTSFEKPSARRSVDTDSSSEKNLASSSDEPTNNTLHQNHPANQRVTRSKQKNQDKDVLGTNSRAESVKTGRATNPEKDILRDQQNTCMPTEQQDPEPDSQERQMRDSRTNHPAELLENLEPTEEPQPQRRLRSRKRSGNAGTEVTDSEQHHEDLNRRGGASLKTGVGGSQLHDPVQLDIVKKVQQVTSKEPEGVESCLPPESDEGSTIISLPDPSHEPSVEVIGSIPELFQEADSTSRPYRHTKLHLVSGATPTHQGLPRDEVSKGDVEDISELIGSSQPVVKKHSPLANAGVFGQVYKTTKSIRLSKSPGKEDLERIGEKGTLDITEKVNKMYSEAEGMSAVASSAEKAPESGRNFLGRDTDATIGIPEVDSAPSEGESIDIDPASQSDLFDRGTDAVVDLTEQSDAEALPDQHRNPCTDSHNEQMAQEAKEKPRDDAPERPAQDMVPTKSDWELALELAREFDTEPRQFSLRSSRMMRSEPPTTNNDMPQSRTKPELEVSVKPRVHHPGNMEANGPATKNLQDQPEPETSGMRKGHGQDQSATSHCRRSKSSEDRTIIAGKKILRRPQQPSTCDVAKTTAPLPSKEKRKRQSGRRSSRLERIPQEAEGSDREHGGTIESYDSTVLSRTGKAGQVVVMPDSPFSLVTESKTAEAPENFLGGCSPDGKRPQVSSSLAEKPQLSQRARHSSERHGQSEEPHSLSGTEEDDAVLEDSDKTVSLVEVGNSTENKPYLISSVADKPLSGSDTESIELNDSEEIQFIQLSFTTPKGKEGNGSETEEAMETLKTSGPEERWSPKTSNQGILTPDCANISPKTAVFEDKHQDPKPVVDDIDCELSAQQSPEGSMKLAKAGLVNQDDDPLDGLSEKLLKSTVPETFASEVSQGSTPDDVPDNCTKKTAALCESDIPLTTSNLQSQSSSEKPKSLLSGTSVKSQNVLPESMKSVEDSSTYWESEKILVPPPVHYAKTFIEESTHKDTQGSQETSPKEPLPLLLQQCHLSSKRKSCPEERTSVERTSKRQRSAGALPEIRSWEIGGERRSRRLQKVEASAIQDAQEKKNESDVGPLETESDVVSTSLSMRCTEDSVSSSIQTKRKSRSLSHHKSSLKSHASPARSMPISDEQEPLPQADSPKEAGTFPRESQTNEPSLDESQLTVNTNQSGPGPASLSTQGDKMNAAEEPSSSQDMHHELYQEGKEATSESLSAVGSSSLFSSPARKSPASSSRSSGRIRALNSSQKRKCGRASDVGCPNSLPKDSNSYGSAIDHSESLFSGGTSEHSKTEQSTLSSKSPSSVESSSRASKASLSFPFQGRPQQLLNPTGDVLEGQSENPKQLSPSCTAKLYFDDCVPASEGASISPEFLSDPIIVTHKPHRSKKTEFNLLGDSIHPTPNSGDVSSGRSSKRQFKFKKTTSKNRQPYSPVSLTEDLRSKSSSSLAPTENSRREKQSMHTQKSGSLDGASEHTSPFSSSSTSRTSKQRKRKSSTSSSGKAKQFKNTETAAVNQEASHEARTQYTSGPTLDTGLGRQEKQHPAEAETQKDNKNCIELAPQMEYDSSGDAQMVSAEDDEPPSLHNDQDPPSEIDNSDSDIEDGDDDVIIPPTPPCQSTANLSKKQPAYLNHSSIYSKHHGIQPLKSLRTRQEKRLSKEKLQGIRESSQAPQNPEVASPSSNLKPEHREAKTESEAIQDSEDEDFSFVRRTFPLSSSPIREDKGEDAFKELEVRAGALIDASENTQSLSIFHVEVVEDTSSEGVIRRSLTREMPSKEAEAEDQRDVTEFPAHPKDRCENVRATETGSSSKLSLKEIRKAEDIRRADEQNHSTCLRHYDTEGSSCSESNYSHQLNLTSASSVLSSQNELMNSQQQLKAKESLKKMALEIARLEAALENDMETQGHLDSTLDKPPSKPQDRQDDSTDNQGPHSIHQSPLVSCNAVINADPTCLDDPCPASDDPCTPADLFTPDAHLLSQADNGDTEEVYSEEVFGSSDPCPTLRRSSGCDSSSQRSARRQRSVYTKRSRPVILDDESETEEEIDGSVGRVDPSGPEGDVNSQGDKEPRNSVLEIPGVTTYGSDSELSLSSNRSASEEEIGSAVDKLKVSGPEDDVISVDDKQPKNVLEIPGVTTYGSDSELSLVGESDVPLGSQCSLSLPPSSPRSPSPPPDVSQSSTKRSSMLANLPESVKAVSRLAEQIRSRRSAELPFAPHKSKTPLGFSKKIPKQHSRANRVVESSSSDEELSTLTQSPSGPGACDRRSEWQRGSGQSSATSGWIRKSSAIHSGHQLSANKQSKQAMASESLGGRDRSTPLREPGHPPRRVLNSSLNSEGRSNPLRRKWTPEQGARRSNHEDKEMGLMRSFHGDDSGDERPSSPVIGRSLLTTPAAKKKTKPLSFVTTGLNRTAMRDVEDLTNRFGCRFASTFNACTTHVIVNTDENLVCERTLKYFQGIASGVWVISFKWVKACLKTDELLPEEPFEVLGDVVNGPSHHGPHTARRHPGPKPLQRYDICCTGPFTGLNKEQLVSLVELMGASTVQHPSLFPYGAGRRAIIIAQAEASDLGRDYDALYKKYRVPVISREWILDNIATYTVQPIANYVLSPSEDTRPIVDLDSDAN